MSLPQHLAAEYSGVAGTDGLAAESLDAAERVTTFNQVHAVTFSDTIVLFTQGTSLTGLRMIVIMTTELLNKALHQ